MKTWLLLVEPLQRLNWNVQMLYGSGVDVLNIGKNTRPGISFFQKMPGR
jgi:hypothetical protein